MTTVPFPIDPDLPREEIQRAAMAYRENQLAVIRRALGTDWPAQRAAIEGLLMKEVNARLEALGGRVNR